MDDTMYIENPSQELLELCRSLKAEKDSTMAELKEQLRADQSV